MQSAGSAGNAGQEAPAMPQMRCSHSLPTVSPLVPSEGRLAKGSAKPEWRVMLPAMATKLSKEDFALRGQMAGMPASTQCCKRL